MIQVLAIIATHPGKRSEVLAAFNANRAAVLAEAGCIEYGAVVDAANLPPGWATFGADTFVVVEKWESMDALKAHAKAPHMLAYGAQTKELVASRAIHVLEPVGG
ncbi:putative quinol monooxygenase [Pseudorhodoferax sp. Leaf265]|jgi:quinol monooxygenase YgiN|uniref:putative quinol monooxygenase n=1 Tax=Pseudorhodoferax sp. Leaf265 TaxID=1736315 RepID=UPI0006F585FD|nr:putative quinol monooxygenase [Pseudorhodoferax sp. Leaf265]KQP02399.1 antibiotic biosynthesis monooxygenase [Pseudorhodoferax sp. Leaf265]PZP96939.1 MAG: antibiotic biosynthesis monooxygenase [Variovorax paradoxus]PZQ08075.1 MAG: antibiotic biosynthesis monooxygenase [Variovorax paradoxus]